MSNYNIDKKLRRQTLYNPEFADFMGELFIALDTISNKTQIAKRLGVTDETIRNWMRRHKKKLKKEGKK